MPNSFAFPALVSFLVTVGLLNVRAQEPMPAPPSNFDASAKAPPNLPKVINIPQSTRIDVKCWRKKPLPPPTMVVPPEQNARLIGDPDLESAVIERSQNNIHAVFNWEGNRSSEAFVIGGLCFSRPTLGKAQVVYAMGTTLTLWLNGHSPNEGAGGDFPDIDWYSPSTYAGTASLDGETVLVFTPGGKKAESANSASTDFPQGESLCLNAKTLLPVWLNNELFVYTFSYTPNSNVQINPQGVYLQAIQKQFGHYP